MIQLPAHGCPFLCPWDLLLPIHLLTSHATNIMNLSFLEKLESWKNYRSCHNKATLTLACSSSTIHSRFSSLQLPHVLVSVACLGAWPTMLCHKGLNPWSFFPSSERVVSHPQWLSKLGKSFATQLQQPSCWLGAMHIFPYPTLPPWSGIIPAAKIVSSFLICWSLDTKNPKCSSSSRSVLSNRSRMLAAVSPDQQDSPLGTRTLTCYTQDWGIRNHNPLRWPFRRMTVEASPLPTFPSQPQIVFL